EASERERAGVSPWESLQTGLFIARKGQMKPPLAGGKIVGGYGWKTDNVTNLKSFSPGVEIHGKPNYNVRAIADGVIVYVGSLRGYGNFVIVAHDDGFYSTYGGLGRVKVQLDQRIPEREPVGVTDDGIVKFELRRGQEAVDPIEWLDFSQLQ
ncbi:MAG TPA: peptidoglycan DD-metalloendopeptidase family protein, partial [candidate division Zixibacteria bacterium]|nr:peptidoglycan DD-metalloendopeptidase family protein [candidate division Zixibacteria bacterium]